MSLKIKFGQMPHNVCNNIYFDTELLEGCVTKADVGGAVSNRVCHFVCPILFATSFTGSQRFYSVISKTD